MKDKMEVLIVEDDALSCSEMVDVIADSDDLLLIGSTNNAKKAVEIILAYLPDAVVLDLELYHGYGSGFDVLKSLQSLEILKRPYMLVTTDNSSPTTYEMARNFGADFIIPKHQEGYSVKTVIDFLQMARPVIKNMQKNVVEIPVQAKEETMEQGNRRISRRIMSELNLLGVSPKSVGYAYLVEAITLQIKQPTSNLCALIAKNHEKTEASIKMAMQNAINRTWRDGNLDELLKHYTAKINVNKGNPTLVEFICFYANKLRSEY